ncbi:MAG: peroxiredoxin family protein [Vicingaceae bacterium]|nr:peroxiredoxin family protein [Vicingaceae bacterium]
MKKISAILFVFVIVILISYFGYKSIKKHNINKQVELTLNELPVFSFYTLNKEEFTYSNATKQQTLIIYFHPECEHCQYETKQLVLNKEKFFDTQILMISPAELTDIKQFKIDYNLNNLTHFNLLWDKDRKFESYFGKSTFPTLLIYNQENKLQKKYKGEVKIETVLNYIGNNQSEKINEVFFKTSKNNHFLDINIIVYLFEGLL